MDVWLNIKFYVNCLRKFYFSFEFLLLIDDNKLMEVANIRILKAWN